MPMGGPSKVRWGAGLANTLWLPWIDNALSRDDLREGSEEIKYVAGPRDAWVTGWDPRLAMDWPWIPTTNTIDPVATGWDGTAGVRAFLRWARAKNLIAWHGDARNLQPNPLDNPSAGAGGVATGWTAYNAGGGTGVTYAIEQSAQRINVTHNTGAITAAGIEAVSLAPVAPGASISYSIEALTQYPAGTGNVALRRDFVTAGGASLGMAYVQLATNVGTTGQFTRYASGVTVVPATAAFLRIRPIIYAETGTPTGAYTAWYRRVQVEYGAASAFVNSDPSISCYLVEPWEEEPEPELDGTRSMRVVLESTDPAITFDGY